MSNIKRNHLVPRKRSTWALIIWYLVIFSMVEWPGWQIANRVEPMIGGLPFIFVWATIWWAILMVTMFLTAWKVLR